MDRASAAPDAGPIGFVNDFYKANQTVIQSAVVGIASMDNKMLEGAINTFGDTAKVMMKGLTALGQVHPAIGGAWYHLTHSQVTTNHASVQWPLSHSISLFHLT